MAARRRRAPRGVSFNDWAADLTTKLEAQNDTRAQLLQEMHKLEMVQEASLHELKMASKA